MQREQVGDRAQGLQAEIANANHEITKVQEGFLSEIFAAEEAKTRTNDARERIERAERKLKNMQSAGEMREELVAALRLLEIPLTDFLEGLPPETMARLCRSVFQHFSIRTSGVAQRRVAEITSYELTPMVKQALVDTFNNVSVTPALEMV